MTSSSLLYIIIFLVGVLSILVVLMGFEKILKLIFGNYIITVIIISLSFLIDFSIKQILSNNISFLGIGPNDLTSFLSNGKLTIITVLYLLGLFIWYKYSHIVISLDITETKKKGLILLIVPLCVIGIVLSLLIIMLGGLILDLGRILKNIPDHIGIRNFIIRVPLWVVLHGIIVYILSMKIHFKNKEEMHFVDVDEYSQK